MSDHKTQFDSEGYVLLRDWFDAAAFAAMRQATDRYIREVVPGLPGTEVFYEDKTDPTTAKQCPRMEDHDPEMEALRREPRLHALACELLADDVRLGSVQWFNKPARIGGPTAPHQDGFYFMLEPNEALTVWIPLVPVDAGNSCVRYVPGSHRCGMRPHGRSGVLGFSQQITDFGDADRAAEVAVVCGPGDLLVHHSMTIHRAEPNRSERDRPALGITYYAARSQMDHARRAEYLANLERDLAEQGKI